jgi:hypothetical protein
MAHRQTHDSKKGAVPVANETFELKRFVWATPDRLEIAGRFVGLGDGATGDPVLVLRGADRTHRLPAVGDGATVGEGQDWHAVFAWQEPPTAFGTAELELGGELLVELPEPRRGDDESELGVIDVRRRGGNERLRLQSELFTIRSELGEAHARSERLERELARAREDLDEERAGRAADAKSFREGLQQSNAVAGEALAEAMAEVEALRTRTAELTSRNAELAATGTEAEQLRARLASIREILDDGMGDGRDVGGDAASP